MNTSSPLPERHDADFGNGPAKLSLPGAGKGRLGAGEDGEVLDPCDLGGIFHVARTVFGADDAAGKGGGQAALPRQGRSESVAPITVEVSANWQR